MWSVELPGEAWCDHYGKPVVIGDVVYALCGTHAAEGDDPVLVAIEPATGRLMHVVTVDTSANVGQDIVAGYPAACGEDVLLPVYLKDRWLRIYRLDSAGAVAATYEIGADDDERGDLKVFGYDTSNKLWPGTLAAPSSDAFSLSWLYRQSRFYRTEWRNAGGLLRAEPEWRLAVCRGRQVGLPMGDDAFNVRDATSGELLWSMARSKAEIFLAFDGDALAIADRSERLADVDDALLEERPLRGRSRIVLLDAATGRLRAEFFLMGDPVGADLIDSRLTLIVSGPDGHELVDTAGLRCPLPGPAAVVGASADGGVVLCGASTAMVASRSGVVASRPLHGAVDGFRARIADRDILAANAVVHGTTLIYRAGRRLSAQPVGGASRA